VTLAGSNEEEALISVLLLNGQYFNEVSMIVQERDFYREEFRLIWRAMETIDSNNTAIDLVSVRSLLAKKKCLTRVGGSSFLSGLTDVLCDPANVKHYARAIKDASNGRKLKQVGKRLMNDDIDPERRLDIGFSMLAEINKSAAYGKKVHAGEVSASVLSTIIGGNGFLSGVKTGFYELDGPLNGLQNQSYYILGARPSVGKSAMALQISANVAREGQPVLYVSPEMTKEQLVTRLLSLESGVPYDDIIKGKVKADYTDALIEANDRIQSMPLHIDDSSDQTVGNVRLKARQHAGSGLSLLVVDYLQLLCPDDDDKATVTKISKGLKAIAKDMDIPVLACAQLRRRYGQEAARPDSSRLKGSGQIEQDADGILLIHPKNDDRTLVEVFIDKHRNGPLGQTVLKFDKETTKFEETQVW
jgi:replicative DNA helicase